MSNDDARQSNRLSQIDTLWSVVRAAHSRDQSEVASAQQKLLAQYGGAIHRYLIASLRDHDVADELYQEFALKFVDGKFHMVDPSKGQFRNYIKRVLYQLIAGYYRSSNRRKEVRQPAPTSAVGEDVDVSESEEVFLVSWREQVLEGAWKALANHEQSTGVRYHSILRLRVEQPALSTAALAAKWSQIKGETVTPGTLRVTLHRAREKFGSLLIESVAESLVDPSTEQLESELIELRLLPYCRDNLKARREER